MRKNGFIAVPPPLTPPHEGEGNVSAHILILPPPRGEVGARSAPGGGDG